jgi:hypothetical protein
VKILMAVAADVAACGSREVGFGLLFTAGRMGFAGVGVKRGERRNPAGGREGVTGDYEQQCQDRHLSKSFDSGLFSEAEGGVSGVLLSGRKRGKPEWQISKRHSGPLSGGPPAARTITL